MSQDLTHIIQTTKDGVLDSNSPRSHVEGLATRAVASGRPIVLHIHGGLVTAPAAYETVNALQPKYIADGLFPIFIVWRTGILDAVKNAGEIAKKPLFEKLLVHLLKFFVGKVHTSFAKGFAGAREPSNSEVEHQLSKREQGEIPYADQSTTVTSDELTPEERKRLEIQLRGDEDLKDAWNHEVKIAKEDVSTPRLDNDVVDEAAKAPSKAVLSSFLIAHSIKIAASVLKRLYKHSDHGLHVTIVEEILRELFLDSIGAVIWGFMKQDSDDTFKSEDELPERGGWLLAQLLRQNILTLHGSAERNPTVSIVAHSAGAIYACNLLRYLEATRGDPRHQSSGIRLYIDKMVFLAPACTFGLFDQVLISQTVRPLFRLFRMFCLTDEHERGYYEVPILYPSSLLYLVSGLFEDPEKVGICDQPLLGMQRFWRTENPFTAPELLRVKEFFQSSPERMVLSGDQRGPGLSCDSRRHGEFDRTELTITSYLHFLKQSNDA